MSQRGTPRPRKPDPAADLVLALRAGDTRSVAQFLHRDPALANWPGPEGLTPLHEACVWAGAEMVQLLLRHNADPNLKDASGRAPLHAAAGAGAFAPHNLRGGDRADILAGCWW